MPRRNAAAPAGTAQSTSSNGVGTASSPSEYGPPPKASLLTIPLGLRGRFVLSIVVAAIVTYLATVYFSESARAYLVWFWFDDLPPLAGTTRIYIYLTLFLTAITSPWARPHLGDSPLQAPELFDYTLPRFFSREGAMKVLHSEIWVNYYSIHLIRTITVGGFIACIVGVGGVIPPVLVGIGMFLQHGVVSGCIGTSHRWYVPVYTCLALMFANGNGDLSVDAYLYDLYGSSYPFAPVCTGAASSILCSGFARKMILMSGMSTLFFGAITKMINGGWAWLDGESLCYYVSSEENGRSMVLKNMFKIRFLSAFLSYASIGLEAGVIFSVFVPWTRPILIAKAAGLHLGIWLTMWPNYFPQTVCYMIGMAWWNEAGLAAPFVVNESTLFASWIGFAVWAFLCMVALLRIECWPLTGIPMYSFYRDSSYSYKFLRDAAQAQRVAHEHIESGYPNAIAWSNLWITLRLKNTDPAVIAARHARLAAEGRVSPSEGRSSADARSATSSEKEFVNIKLRVHDTRFTRNGTRGVYIKQWRRTLHNIAALDMTAKPWGNIEAVASDDEQQFPATEWLHHLLPHLHTYASQYGWNLPSWVDATGELQLRVKLKDRYAILAAIPWQQVAAAAGGNKKEN